MKREEKIFKAFGISVLAAGLAAGIAANLGGCKFLSPSDEDSPSQSGAARVSSLSLSPQTISMSVGGMKYATLSVSPSSARASAKLRWEYDAEILDATCSNSGAVLTAKKEGSSRLTVSADGISATCIVTVSGYDENWEQDPYIYSNYTTVQMRPDEARQVYVSLYGGTAADIDGYTWSCDNPAVAELSPNGQYCQIRAKGEGYSRVKIAHTKAAYPYYIGVYCFADIERTCYLTSSQNIVTLEKSAGESQVEVSLANAGETDPADRFEWEIVGDDGSFSFVSNGNRAILAPLKKGQATLRVRHSKAAYPFDFVVRTIEIVENVTIRTGDSVVYVRGTEDAVVKASLDGAKAGWNPDEFSFDIQNDNVVEGISGGGEVVLRGVANGSTELVISHPLAKYSRTVLIVCQDQIKDAVDASVFITTSQNYVKTKAGADETAISVLLKGGNDGDRQNFSWSVKEGSQFISLSTTDGKVRGGALRAAAQSYESGTAYVKPLAEGTAIVEVSHPKAYYPTEIMVKVYAADALFDEPLYFSGSGLLYMLNGEEKRCEVSLLGTNKSASDEAKIEWTSESANFSVDGSGAEVLVRAHGSGQTLGYIRASHPKCENPKRVLVASADTLEELQAMKGFYSDKLYYSLSAGDEAAIPLSSIGFDEGETYSSLAWTTASPAVAEVEKDPSSPLLAVVRAVSAGKTKITASMPGCNSVDFEITVYPKGVRSDVVEPECYLTTGQNVVSIAQGGASKTVSVTAVNLPQSDKTGISWISGDESVCSVVGNGEKATLTALKEGESVVTVSHPKSANSLKIYVRVGSEYVITNEEIFYISAASDVMTFLAGDQAALLKCSLVSSAKGAVEGAGDFHFEIDDEGVAKVASQFANGSAFIAPVAAGQCELTVTQPDAAYSKKIVVAVGNSAEELAAFKYLTTSTNVVTIAKGGSKAVSVEMKNSAEVEVAGYSWSAENPLVASTSATGPTAQIVGNEIGSTKIYIGHPKCAYKLEIYVNVVDANSAAANPYIQLTANVLTLTVSQSWTAVTADLVGGTDEDFAAFNWQTTDAGILQVVGQNEQCKLRAAGAGQCYVTVSHPKAAFPAQLLVVCDTAQQSACSISVAESIINMKPTDGVKSITATLVNGDSLDKYNFKWSLDVYDVIDLSYSGNSAQISPMKTGQVTITITHPKAAYPQQIVVKVSNWTSFAFGSTMATVTAGKTNFISMQVPSSAVETRVEYETLNPNVCAIQGTDAVCQITGLAEGTTSVKAYLVAAATNERQGESTMLVYVEKADVAENYISSTKTIYTLARGLSTTLYAQLTGDEVTATDQNQLQWRSSDESVAKISGADATGVYVGNSAYVTAAKSGEALITISHEKSNSNLVFYIIVPGEAEQTLSLNKSYLQLEKGYSSDVKATISAGNLSYKDIEWSIPKTDGLQVARVLGSGQTVSVYALAAGEAELRAQLPNGALATCQIIVETDKSFAFENSVVRVQPGQTKAVAYSISPFDAGIQWLLNDGTYAMYEDKGNSNGAGRVEITGISEGSTSISAVTTYGNKGTLQIVCNWDYNLYVNKTKISGVPINSYSLDFQVNPQSAVITVDDSAIATSNVVNNGDGTGTITFTPKSEGAETVAISAFNPAVGKVFASTSVQLDFAYNGLTLVATPISEQCVGSFSRYDAENESVIIGDGEKFTMAFRPIETKADAKITGIEFRKAGVNSDEGESLSIEETDTMNRYWTITHNSDKVEQGYLIYEYYDFGSPGAIESPYNRTYISRTTTTSWDGIWKQHHSSCHWRWRKSKATFHNAERDLTFVPAETYKKIDGWWYATTHSGGDHWNYATGCQSGTYGASPVRTVVKEQNVGYIIVSFAHKGKTETASLAVKVEVRNCPAVYPYDMSQDWKYFSSGWY